MKHFFQFITTLGILLLFVLVLPTKCLAQNEKDPSVGDPTKKEPERLWELAIAAKGGRERLESVKSMVVSGENPVYFFGIRVRKKIRQGM
jgi:hypothetical protein